MGNNSFWLIYIQDSYVTVSLISQIHNRYQILATGPKKEWDINSEESLITAGDESLSAAALNANISEDQEPESAAFVVPPFWISNDGKITSPKLKLIKDVCKNLKISPSGFIPEDEAIVEDANQKDSFPASFIILHLNRDEFYLSLVYLGHVKERIRKSFSSEFSGQILESALLEFNSESALPPQIVVFGMDQESVVDKLKNFPWVGKKDVETFLHFPEIKSYQDHEILSIFSRVITSSQLQENHPQESVVIEDDQPEETPTTEELSLEEVDPESFGFSPIDLTAENKTENQVEPQPEIIPEPNLDPFVPEILPPPVVQNANKIKFSLDFFKKIKLPKFKTNNIFWILLILSPLLFAVPLIFSKTDINLFVTPYQFNKQVSVTLKSNTNDANLNQLIIPIDKQVFEITATSKIKTTGQKTVGDKAKGEIVIFNKVDKSQNIPKGSILTDSSGKKFELTTAVSIASSSSNLNEGVINLGQTKTVASASDIGSEFNINKDIQLRFKDFSDTVVIAKTNENFTGGSKNQISAVSSQDKADLEEKINQEINKNIEDKINNDLKNTSGIIKETIQTKKNKLDFSREIDEEADELGVTAQASVTVFTLSNEVKEKLIKQVLADQPDFNNTNIDINNFNLTFKVTKIDSDKAIGVLTIEGKSLPKIDLDKIKHSLVGKTTSHAGEIIKKSISRVYNFHIQNNFPLGLLPFRWENINIQIKSESL